MDGIQAVCLNNSEKSCHGASKTRSKTRSFTIQLLLYSVHSVARTSWLLELKIFQKFTQRLKFDVLRESPLLARAELHHQDSFENLYRVEVWTVRIFRLWCGRFDYTPTRSLPFGDS